MLLTSKNEKGEKIIDKYDNNFLPTISTFSYVFQPILPHYPCI